MSYDWWAFRYTSPTGRGHDQIRFPATTPVASKKEAQRLASERYPGCNIYGWSYLGTETINDAERQANL